MHTIALDDNSQNVCPPFVFATNFDYSQFENGELQSKAKTTLNQFIGFVRQTFDGLLENGQACAARLSQEPSGQQITDASWCMDSESTLG